MHSVPLRPRFARTSGTTNNQQFATAHAIPTQTATRTPTPTPNPTATQQQPQRQFQTEPQT